MRTNTLLLGPLAALFLAGNGAASAEESTPPPTWQAGLSTTMEGATSIHGGVAHGRTLQALALANVEWNQPGLPRGESGLHAYASLLGLTGRGPSERFAGDLLAVSNIEGHRSVRFYSCWVEGRIASWQWRAGNLLADEEFAGTEPGSQFANSVFGWPAFISANTVNTGPAFFVPALGLRLRYAPTDSGYWQAGIYDGDSFDSAAGDATVNPHGLHFRVGGPQGWFAMVERGWTPPDSSTRWKVGGWFHSASFPDLFADTNGRSAALTGQALRWHRYNYGGYACVEQTVAGRRGEPGHIQAFLRTGFAPGDRSPLGWAVDTGVVVNGLLPGRPNDIAALGFARGSFSRDYRNAQRDAAPGDPAPDFEEVVEFSYAIPAGEHATVRPSLQHIRHPGGNPAATNALIGLLRLETKF